MEFSITRWIGHLHPVVVHLPIGFIILAVLLPFIKKVKSETIRIIWGLTFLTSLVSVLSGWFLANQSTYPSMTLFLHRWLAIILMIVALYMWWKYNNISRPFSRMIKTGHALIIIALIYTGHLGGTMTHGEDFMLRASPSWMQSMMGYNKIIEPNLSSVHVDSIKTYTHLISPIVDAKCTQCHNSSTKNGGLDLSHPDSILIGGLNGSVLTPGNARESEFFSRLILAKMDKRFMPPKGEGLSYDEINLIKWWIDSGADFKVSATELSPDQETISIIQKLYKVDLTPRPWYMKVDLPPLEKATLSRWQSTGLSVQPFAQGSGFINVDSEGKAVAIPELEEGLERILKLDVSSETITQDVWSAIGRMKNLISLDLRNTTFDPNHQAAMKSLSRLEVVNFFGSDADGSCLLSLASHPSVQRIYVWQSGITATDIEAYKKAGGKAEIIVGM